MDPNTFKPQRSRVRRPANGHEARFSVAVQNLLRQSHEIAEKQSIAGDGVGALRAILNCAVTWGAYLVGATSSHSILIENDRSVQALTSAGTPTEWASLAEGLYRKRQATPDARTWLSADWLVTFQEMRYRFTSCFIYTIPTAVEPHLIDDLNLYSQIAENVVQGIERNDFVADQRRILGRRTIIAQLRPNDLIYHVFDKLQKYVGWNRSALLLAPLDDHGWQVVAERLAGVRPHRSRRVGHRYRLPLDGAQGFSSLLIKSLDNHGCTTAFAVGLLEIIADVADLPSDLPPPASALALKIGLQPGEEIGGSHILILTDMQPSGYDSRDLHVAREFVRDLNGLLLRSHEVSSRLVNLWTPAAPSNTSLREAAHDEATESPAAIEAIPIEAVPETAPAVLSLDSLQVVQFYRGVEAGTKRESISPLAIRAVGQSVSGTRGVRLHTGVTPPLEIQLTGTLIGDVLTTGQHLAVKSLTGIDSASVGGLFESTDGGKRYGAVYIFPITVEESIGGLVVGYRSNASELIEIDRILMASFAASLGERLQLRRQLADHSRLSAAIGAIAAARTDVNTREQLVRRAAQLLNADHSFLMELDVEGDDAGLECVAHTWRPEEMFVPRLKTTGEGEGITGRVFTTGEPIAASDVTQNDYFLPVSRPDGTAVPISSELSVPVVAPLATAARGVVGVLNVFWHRPHRILHNEQVILRTLGQHAGAVLRLARNLNDAEQRRDRLERLISTIGGLESASTEADAFAWVCKQLEELVEFDLAVIWRQESAEGSLDIVSKIGRRADALPLTSVACGGWIGSQLSAFRQRNVKTAIDRYDNPSPIRTHIAGTPEVADQAAVGYFFRPHQGSGIPDKEDVACAITMYRFRKSNFDPRDSLTLFLLGTLCEAASTRITAMSTKNRTFELTLARERIVQDLLLQQDAGRMMTTIAETMSHALNAHSVAIILYPSPMANATRYTYPPQRTDNLPPRTRQSGVSEWVRKVGKLTVIDLNNPPPDLIEAIATSSYYLGHPDVKSTVAIPLPDDPESAFSGVLYVNFGRVYVESEVETHFVKTMLPIVSAVGRLSPTLARMREATFASLRAVRNPAEVFQHVLVEALGQMRLEIPPHFAPGRIRLCGNIYMVARGARIPRLRVRAIEGEISGNFASVQDSGEGVVGKVARDGRAAIVKDTNAEPGYLPYLRGMRSELAVPISMESEVATGEGFAPRLIGVLNVECSEPDFFTNRHEVLLSRYVEMPVASMLHLAERHNQLLWQERRELDELLIDSTVVLLHDVTRPARTAGTRAKTIRSRLPPSALRLIETELRDIERESREAQDLERVGVKYLRTEILEARAPLNVIEVLKRWARGKTPPVKVSVPRAITDFYVDSGHPMLINSVLDNLYHNSKAAIRRRRKAGSIWIDIALSGTPPLTYLDVLFQDNGTGIPYPPDEWPQLFRIFSRRKTKPGSGWGLGLPFARLMMQVMHGELDAISGDHVRRPAKRLAGATFRLRFSAMPRLGR